MITKAYRGLNICIVAALGAGCATHPTPPILDLSKKECTAAARLVDAIPLSIGKTTTAEFDDSTPCVVNSDGSRQTYQIFALASPPNGTMLSITSDPVGQGLLSPIARLTDARGHAIREIPSDQFTSRGTSLHVAVRVHPNESLLWILSNPESIGSVASQLLSTAQVSTMSVGVAGFVRVGSGNDSMVQMTRSHSGVISVVQSELPKPEATHK